MFLVLDNTVLSNFALVGRAELLQKLWPDELVTAEEAWQELQNGIRLGRVPGVDWSWLSVLSLTIEERTARDGWMPPLDIGEAACLALAHFRSFGLLTDDRVARREARRLGVRLSGTIGALTSLVDEGVLAKAEANQILHQMILVGYHSPMQSL